MATLFDTISTAIPHCHSSSLISNDGYSLLDHSLSRPRNPVITDRGENQQGPRQRLTRPMPARYPAAEGGGMAEQTPAVGMQRKLAAIFSTDVAGYSRLMGDDEEATIRILTAYRSIISSLIQQ